MQKFHYYLPIFFQKVAYILFYVVYKLFLNIKIVGKENIRGLTGPIILAPNHTSELDPTVIPLLLPFISSLYPIYFVTNPTEKYKTFGWRSYLYGGTFFNILGGYPVYSGNKDYAVALESHIRLLKNGQTLCIFPEGKRTRDGHLNPARGGLGYLVATTGASVVPVAIDTFFNLTLWDFILRRRALTIAILPRMGASELLEGIHLNEPTAEDYRDIGQKVLDEIREVL
jgi:1-acyl-sn-glycerol-3-phosphate acyltransferase